MNKYFKTIASAMVVFSLLISALATSASIAIANTEFDTNFGFDTSFDFDNTIKLPDTNLTNSSNSVYESNYSATECSIKASRSRVNVGEGVELTWKTSGFNHITINGEVVSGNNGSITMANVQDDTTYRLEATNDSGSKCTSEVRVGCDKPVNEYCELNLTKSVNKQTALPGDILTYTIVVKSVGTIDCTGGGVHIADVMDANVTYINSSVTSNFDLGYHGYSVYDAGTRTLHFNGHELSPGQSGTITWTGKVNDPAQCGDFEVTNQAKATAFELNNFKDWTLSNVVKTKIDNEDCGDTPKPPVCPLTAKAGRTIVDFGNNGAKLLSNSGLAASQTNVIATNVPAGTFDITLVSWDGYLDRVNVTQPRESYFVTLNLANGSSVNTNSIADLADFVVQATNVEKVNSGLVLNSAITSLQGKHSAYVDNSSANSLVPICLAFDSIVQDPAPTCDMFKATPATIMVGASSTLAWETSNATQVFLNNGIGAVAVDGSIEVSPLADIVYKLTVIGTKDQTVNCEVPVKVSEDSVPVCEMFTATPSSLPVGGGNVTLNWKVLGATSASIAPTIGTVALIDSKVVNVTSSTNFILTATDADGDKVTCPAPVVVADPAPLTCANNVVFTTSATSIRRGNDAVLNWSTKDVDSVSISVINSTALAGTKTVAPDVNTTYVLTAKAGSSSIECPVSVAVTTSGGGGGSNTPRCDLEISDTKISLGDSIKLKWDTTNATDITLTDSSGKVIVTTKDKSTADKKDLFDGTISLKPTKNTEYTLLAKRGSKERICKVEVKMDDLVVLQTRDQQPLVAGISLSQVPYTGFEAGPLMTIMFYVLLMAWAFYIAYLIVAKKKLTTTNGNLEAETVMNPGSLESMQVAEARRPDVFTTASVAEVAVPVNLPVATPVVGYENQTVETKDSHRVSDVTVTNLENHAHAQKALLSSDAVRHLVSTTNEIERMEALDAVIVEAKKNYPLEDGWIVINESRMKNLCEACQVNVTSSVNPNFTPAVVPEGAGSLAEAIVSGNVVAAYELIGHRPMFALADAAADLDALYRSRRGGNVKVSTMLISETANLSDEKIKAMITALTGALDGTYTDEASAVKMAIMKAVKAAA